MQMNTRGVVWAGGLAASLLALAACAGNDDQPPTAAAIVWSASQPRESLPPAEHERLPVAVGSSTASAPADQESDADAAGPAIGRRQQLKIRARAHTRWTWLEDLSHYDAPTILNRVDLRHEQRRTRTLSAPR